MASARSILPYAGPQRSITCEHGRCEIYSASRVYRHAKRRLARQNHTPSLIQSYSVCVSFFGKLNWDYWYA